MATVSETHGISPRLRASLHALYRVTSSATPADQHGS